MIRKIGVEEKGIKFYAKRISFFQFHDYGYRLRNSQTTSYGPLRTVLVQVRTQYSIRITISPNIQKQRKVKLLVWSFPFPYRSYKNHKT